MTKQWSTEQRAALLLGLMVGAFAYGLWSVHVIFSRIFE